MFGLFTLLFAFTMSYGQATEAVKSMSQGNQNSFSINLPNCDKKDVEKSWGKYLKKHKCKTDKVKKTDEFRSDNAKIEAMSDNTVDVFARVNQEGTDAQLTVWYDLGGAYLSSESHPEKVTVANAMLDDFALSMAVANVQEELKSEEKTMKKMGGDFKGLEKDKKKLEDDIVKFEKKIEEAKAAIVANEAAQEAMKESMKNQEGVIEGVKTKLKNMN